MLVNADFSRRVFVAPHQYQWVPSPQGDIERVMLDRIGGEKARATSLVRYAPGSCFPAHQHPGGEEILVLSGTFCEDNTHYPAGSYLRNPPGSMHQPCSPDGAVIFVKLWQMSSSETMQHRINTNDSAMWQRIAGRNTCPLYCSTDESVYLEKVLLGELLLSPPPGGAELLVLAGTVITGSKHYSAGSWMRLPAGDATELTAGAQGATIYVKSGHLNNIAVQEYA
jgi:anti-sigma factor ChrR (cupin superfamily)